MLVDVNEFIQERANELAADEYRVEEPVRTLTLN